MSGVCRDTALRLLVHLPCTSREAIVLFVLRLRWFGVPRLRCAGASGIFGACCLPQRMSSRTIVKILCLRVGLVFWCPGPPAGSGEVNAQEER